MRISRSGAFWLPVSPERFCYRPVTVRDRRTNLGEAIARLKSAPGADVIQHDLIVVWGEDKRTITGADLLGRLLHGIATPDVS